MLLVTAKIFSEPNHDRKITLENQKNFFLFKSFQLYSTLLNKKSLN